MTSNGILNDARVARVRELTAALAEANARLVQAEAERNSLIAHLHVAVLALHDLGQLPANVNLRIIDGWNAILRGRNVSKLTAEDISSLKNEYLASLGIPPASTSEPPHGSNAESPVTTWIVFDGPEENSCRSGQYRVTYTGGDGPHRADRLILDYVHAVKLLGLDTSRVVVETADKQLAKKLAAFGATVTPPPDRKSETLAQVCEGL